MSPCPLVTPGAGHRDNKGILLFLILSAFVFAAAAPVERIRDLPAKEELLALDVRFHRQITKHSCGAAILHSVLSYWGSREASQMGILRQHPPESEEGDYSLGEMKRIAIELGFKAYVIPADEDFIKKQLRLGRPVIVPVTLEYGRETLQSMGMGEEEYRKISEKHKLSYNHYLALIGMGEGSFVVLDPTRGIYLMDREQVARNRAPHKEAALLLAL